MNFLSVCSGIEAASVAFSPLGWKALAFAEIDQFPRAVLKHHYPETPLYGDFTTLRDEPWIVDADLLVGGTPCQSFSVAGLRRSLADDRGNLALEYIRLANAIDDLRRAAGRPPAYLLWENVPGVLSTGDNTFGAFLGGLVGSDAPIVPGERWADAGVVAGPQRVAAWRTLDAQHFGLAQRRRRVFVLAIEHPRGWACAEALLPIIESLSGHPAPRREAGESAPTLPSRRTAGGGLGTDFDYDGGLIHCATVAPTLNAHFGDKQGLEDQHALNGAGLFIAHAFDARQSDVLQYGDMTGPLDTDGCSIGVAYGISNQPTPKFGIDISPSLDSKGAGGGRMEAVAQGMAVRRLTPREAERLQGFPDDYTLIPYRGKPAADGPRYKALGNSMAVPVMSWIGQRIAFVEAVTGNLATARVAV